MPQTTTKTAAALEKTMTVAQLIAFLSRFDGSLPVLIPNGTADYWGRAPLSSVEAYRTEELPVHYSEYHRALITTTEADEEARLLGGQETVALILG